MSGLNELIRRQRIVERTANLRGELELKTLQRDSRQLHVALRDRDLESPLTRKPEQLTELKLRVKQVRVPAPLI